MRKIFINKNRFSMAIASLFLLSIMLVYFNKIIFTPGTIPGFGLDPYFCLFVIKSNADKLIQMDFRNLPNLPFFYPKTNTLAFSDPLIFHSVLFAFLKLFCFSETASMRIIFFGFFILNWIACSFFCWNLKTHNILSILIGWLFAFSLFFQVQSAHYQNLIVFPIFLMLLPLVSLRLNRSSKFWYPFLGTLAFLSTNLYFFLYGVICFFGIFLILSLINRKSYFKQTSSSAYGVVFASLICIPLILLYYKTKIQYPEISGIRSFEEKVAFSSRPWDYFKVLYTPDIYLDFQKYFLSFEFERSSFSGLAGILLSFGYLLFIVYKGKLIDSKLALVSLVLLFIGTFLSSGPLVLPSIYKVTTFFIPGLSEIRAVGRAGLIINLGIMLSVYAALLSFKKYSKSVKCILTILIIVMFGERFSKEFTHRYVLFEEPINIEADVLLSLAEESSRKSVFVIADNVENNIRIPFYLSIKSNWKTINGYSGYNPKEWNSMGAFYDSKQECIEILKKNEFIWRHSDHLLVSKETDFLKRCENYINLSFNRANHSEHFFLYSRKLLL